MVRIFVVWLFVALLRNGNTLRGLNKANITSYPKRGSPENVSDCRPISLCNVSYKFISKLLANRLCMVPSLIFPLQSAFVPNLDIHDNI